MTRVLDLFCGAGGFTSGFVRVVSGEHLAVDIDETALGTLSQNYPHIRTMCKDISTLHAMEVERALGRPDIIIASPPCEEFSRANPVSDTTAAERIYGSGTARLLLETIRLIGDLRPSVFVIENVAAILDKGGGPIIQSEFHRVGIEEVHFNMIRAHQHGNPSKRLRVFISNIKMSLPRRTPPRVFEVIGDLPPLGLEAIFCPGREVPNHVLKPLSETTLRMVQKTRGRRGMKRFRASGDKMLPNWVRLRPDQIATSIIGHSRYIHPFENRLLTVREHARLMSYPDSFIFTGPMEHQYNQVGESVPPLISRLIAEEVVSEL